MSSLLFVICLTNFFSCWCFVYVASPAATSVTAAWCLADHVQNSPSRHCWRSLTWIPMIWHVFLVVLVFFLFFINWKDLSPADCSSLEYLTTSGLNATRPTVSLHRAHYSTETVVLRVLDDILHTIDSVDLALQTLLDLSASFDIVDIVDYAILLGRLYTSLTVSMNGLGWFTSYRCAQSVRYTDHPVWP